MYIKNNKTTIFITKDKVLSKTPLLFLHGFTGSSASWNYVRKEISETSIAIDIPGHGRSTFNDINDTYDYKDFRTELFFILQHLQIKKIHLCGYSMGGRLAISFAQRFPEMIESLILESTSLGISNMVEKQEQFDKDIELSDKINESIEDFINHWSENKLFFNQSKRNIKGYEDQSKVRLSHDKIQLSKALISFSKGSMPAFQDSFNLFSFPIYLINGHDDSKYIKLNRDMMKINKTAKQFIVNKASHNIHLENPSSFISTINEII